MVTWRQRFKGYPVRRTLLRAVPLPLNKVSSKKELFDNFLITSLLLNWSIRQDVRETKLTVVIKRMYNLTAIRKLSKRCQKMIKNLSRDGNGYVAPSTVTCNIDLALEKVSNITSDKL